jgi:hypothetical protein
VALDAEDIEAIARRVTRLFSAQPSGVVYIDARELAERLCVERSWIAARDVRGLRLLVGERNSATVAAAIQLGVRIVEENHRACGVPAPRCGDRPGLEPRRRAAR